MNLITQKSLKQKKLNYLKMTILTIKEAVLLEDYDSEGIKLY